MTVYYKALVPVRTYLSIYSSWATGRMDGTPPAVKKIRFVKLKVFLWPRRKTHWYGVNVLSTSLAR